jgi:hypothetical protein
MEHRDYAARSEYEAALAEERLAWKQLDEPFADVNEQVKACARWSAAAERARAISERLQQPTTFTQQH